MTFQQFVADLISKRFGTATALADAVGMELSPFNRGVRAGTLNLVNLLKLAQVAEEHPSTVLRLAHKAEEAELLERLYGVGDAVTPKQRAIIDLWERVPEELHDHFCVLLKHAGDLAVHAHGSTKGSRAPRARHQPGR